MLKNSLEKWSWFEAIKFGRDNRFLSNPYVKFVHNLIAVAVAIQIWTSIC